MTRASLLHILDHVTGISDPEVRELEQLAAAFPYCQTAHLLLAKAAHDRGSMLAGQRLRRAATYAADRELLRRLLEQPITEPSTEVRLSSAPSAEADTLSDSKPVADEADASSTGPVITTDVPDELEITPATAFLETAVTAESANSTDLPSTDSAVFEVAIVEPKPADLDTEAESATAVSTVAPAAVTALELTEAPATTTAPAETAATPSTEGSDTFDAKADTSDDRTLLPVANEPTTSVEPALTAAAPEAAEFDDVKLATTTDSAKSLPTTPTFEDGASSPQLESAPSPPEPFTSEEAATTVAAVPTATTEELAPAVAPPIRPPADAGISRFEFGLSTPALPAPSGYQLPTLAEDPEPDENELPTTSSAAVRSATAVTAPFRADEAVGYALGAGSRLGYALQPQDGFTLDLPLEAFFEPDTLLLAHVRAHQPTASSLDLINRFLKTQPRIKTPTGVPLPAAEQADLSVRSNRAAPALVSESLAKIMIRQGKTDKAIEMYERLIARQPEKKAYFVEQIQQLQQPSE